MTWTWTGYAFGFLLGTVAMLLAWTVAHLRVRTRVRDALTDEPSTGPEVAERAGVATSSVYAHLAQLEDEHLCTRTVALVHVGGFPQPRVTYTRKVPTK